MKVKDEKQKHINRSEITGDPLRSMDAAPLLEQSCCERLVKVKSDWMTGAEILVVIYPPSTALSPFQVLIQGGCVKYCDPSSRSPASVSSRGKRLAVSARTSGMKGELQGGEAAETLRLQLLCVPPEGGGTT